MLLSDAADAPGLLLEPALLLGQEGLPALPGPSAVLPSLDASRFQELQKHYKDLLTRL